MTGEEVTVWRATVTGTDGMDEPVCSWAGEQVGNCLVRPYAGDDVSNAPHTHGARVDYTIAFPKAYEGRSDLRGCKVSFRGIGFDGALSVVGAPDVTAPCPTAWDTLAKVGRVYG